MFERTNVIYYGSKKTLVLGFLLIPLCNGGEGGIRTHEEE